MAIFKCKMCGGDLDITDGLSVAECEYCGTKQTLPKVVDENLQALFNRANTLRIKSEFDKAEKIYEKIIQADSTLADAYWGLILCKYGIEYVDDPKTFKKIPTCHRTSFDSIIADDDYKSALEHADISQRVVYEEQAKEIDRIQKEILELAQKEETYDVFICYKETGENGQRTQDSVIANDIYYQLTQEGFKVFYAAITLEGKLGSEYEPIIFAALSSAKVMLAIGTRPEYFSSVWVKNEWSRFLKIMKKDRSKMLFPCYRDMDAYELPEEFAHLQAQDMSKIGFINDVVRGIKKVISKDEAPKTTIVKETVVTTSNANIAPLLERVFMFLEDGDFESANEYCEKVLDLDPKNAEAYLGKLMVDLRVKNRETLSDCAEPFDNNANYNKIMRFGDAKLKAELEGYLTAFKENKIQKAMLLLESASTEQECQAAAELFAKLDYYADAAKMRAKCFEKAQIIHNENDYNRAVNAMERAASVKAYKDAADMFGRIITYKNSADLKAQCLNSAEALQKESLYNRAVRTMNNADRVVDYEDAMKHFEVLRGYKDSDARIEDCRKKIEEFKAKFEAARLERERKAALARVEHKRKNKIAIAILIGIFVFFVVLGILMKTVIIPSLNYNKAISLMEANEYSEAIALLEKLDGYKDSEEKLSQIRYSSVRSAKVGKTVFWGEYEQDNDIKNGKETIEWIVLDIVEGKVFVVSKYGLECKPYNDRYAYLTWKDSTIRSWLNNDFINNAFSTTEKTYISTTTVKADTNPAYSINPGDDTEDKIFLLSYSELIRYFSTKDRFCEFTPYASGQGVSSWWLRTNGKTRIYASVVNHSGDLNLYGLVLDSDTCAVRPAMWIDLSSFK